jgi:carboxypeptidase PM20D1
MFRRAAYALLIAGAVLLVLLAVNVLRLSSRQIVAVPLRRPAVDALGAAQRLSGAVRLRTISYDNPSDASGGAFLALHAYLAESFPHVQSALRREIVNDYSLLYTWAGANPGAKPIVFMAHEDVVPIAPGSENLWHADPFGGEIKDGYVWGRGAWDDKGNLMAILEAVEALAAAGFTPQRTVYLAFGHDEETGGEHGAKAIAALFRQRGVRPEFVLDEGLLITSGLMPGLNSPLALIGVAEKGSATLKLTAAALPGHSSMPGNRTAIGALARALVRLERSPFPASLGGVAGELFETVAPETHGLNRVVLSNLWLFAPVVAWELSRLPSTNALLRTTTAITVVSGGNKENVLPATAEALVNFRTLPGDTAERVVAHVRTVVDDGGIGVDVLPQSSEASPVASRTSAAYRTIARSVRELFPGVVVAPGLMIGATDSRHMLDVADDVYRFSPVRAAPPDLARFHGTDERMSVANYAELIGFYETLIGRAAGP